MSWSTEQWIDSGKTHNARRHLRVPAAIRELLYRQASGRGPTDLLFSRDGKQPYTRQLLHARVVSLCEQARVPRVCPHSLRGLHASLAVDAGVTGEAVAAALGHGSFAITSRHYATPESRKGAAIDSVSSVLDPFRDDSEKED